MILPDLFLPSRINQLWKFSGIDHADFCLDSQHFLSYPHKITYDYNSRGFRDQEWPDTMLELHDAIWCIGDSFTVGLGSPIEHIWPTQLAKITNRRIINVSMDGASNEWIARTVEKIVQTVNPPKLVIMWSHIHRREHANTLLSDEDRRIRSPLIACTEHDDWTNFLDCKKRVELIANSVQFAIPFFCSESRESIIDYWTSMRGPNWPMQPPASVEELDSLPVWILQELNELHGQLTSFRNSILKASPITVKPLDLARDGHHFDLITAEWVATQAKDRLS